MADPAFPKVARSRKLHNRPDPVRAAVPSLPTVLLSVAGLTPQVVTETLYCLVKKTDPSVPIREVRVSQAGPVKSGSGILFCTPGTAGSTGSAIARGRAVFGGRAAGKPRRVRANGTR